jgi:acyl-CoA reductase-like NAD-dependent aldehyde dehydrogenase
VGRPRDVNDAVAAARRGSAEWRRVPPAERAVCMEQLAERIVAHVGELALLDTYDSGNTVTGMRSDMRASAETLKYFAGLCRELKGETFTNGPATSTTRSASLTALSQKSTLSIIRSGSAWRKPLPHWQPVTAW